MFHTAMLSIKQLSRIPITTILFQVHFSGYYSWFLFDALLTVQTAGHSNI